MGYSGLSVILFRILQVPESGLMITRNEMRGYAPFHEEHELSRGICCANDPLWVQGTSEAPQFLRLNEDKIQSKLSSYVKRHITAQETQMLQQTSNKMALSDLEQA